VRATADALVAAPGAAVLELTPEGPRVLPAAEAVVAFDPSEVELQ
jgi:hypothetical protein